MEKARFINIGKGREVLILYGSIYEMLKCYRNFVLGKEFKNKQGVFLCKNAYIKKVPFPWASSSELHLQAQVLSYIHTHLW